MFRRGRVVPGVSQRDDFCLDPQLCALLVVDIQRYLCPFDNNSSTAASYSSYYQENIASVISNIAQLVSKFREMRDHVNVDGNRPTTTTTTTTGCEVIFTYLQAATKDGRDISLDYKLSGPLLANIPTITQDDDDDDSFLFLSQCAPSLNGKGDLKVPKTSCSVFQSTNLDYLLRQLDIEQLVVVGQMTDQCIESAVRDAADLGYFVTVPQDACAATSLEHHVKGLSSMRGFARIVDRTAQVLQELVLAAASHQQEQTPAAATTMDDDMVLAYLRDKGLDESTMNQVAHVLLIKKGEHCKSR